MATTTRSSWITAFEEGLQPSAAARRSAARSTARTHTVRYYGREATARHPEPVLESKITYFAPELKVVTRRRPRRGLVVTVMAMAVLLVGLGFVCPVLVSSAATGVESAIGRLDTQQRELAAAASALSAQVSALSAPERVAVQATGLGLGPAASVQYLKVGSGVAAVEGDTTIAGR